MYITLFLTHKQKPNYYHIYPKLFFVHYEYFGRETQVRDASNFKF